MTTFLATYYGPAFFVALTLPFILGVLWLLALVSSICVFSRRAPVITHGLFIALAWLTALYILVGGFTVLMEDHDTYVLRWPIFLGPVVLPGVLSYAYWRIARRTHGRSPNEPVTQWKRPGAVMAWCVLSWIIAASAYVWYLSGPYIIR